MNGPIDPRYYQNIPKSSNTTESPTPVEVGLTYFRDSLHTAAAEENKQPVGDLGALEDAPKQGAVLFPTVAAPESDVAAPESEPESDAAGVSNSLFGFSDDEDDGYFSINNYEEKRKNSSVFVSERSSTPSSLAIVPRTPVSCSRKTPDASPTISPSKERLKPLSKGGQGTVYEKGSLVYKSGSDIAEEYGTYRGINPEGETNIVQMLKTRNASYLVMPKACSDLSHLVLKLHGFLLSDADIKLKGLLFSDAVIQILNALNTMHKKQFIHCDLKPENLLVYENGLLLLTDLGSTLKAGMTLIESVAVTVRYSAPELMAYKRTSFRTDLDIHDQPFSEKVDIWSLGAIIYFLILGQEYVTEIEDKNPLDIQDLEILDFLLKNQSNPLPKFDYRVQELNLKNKLGEDFFALVEYLLRNTLCVNPMARLSIDQIYEKLTVFLRSLEISEELLKTPEWINNIQQVWQELMQAKSITDRTV